MLLKKLMRISACLIVFAGLMLMSSCAKDDSSSPAGPGDAEYMWVHHEGDSLQVFYSDLETFDVTTLSKPVASENDAIWLSSFVDTELIPNYEDEDVSYDARLLYSYRIEGEDGFCAAIKGYPNNIWDHMDKGYVMIATRRVVFPDDLLDLPGAYNVKDVRHIRIERKFDISIADSSVFVNLADIATQTVQNSDGEDETAVPLSAVIESVLSDPETYTYNIQAIDGYSFQDDMTWADFQTGYWLLTSKKTIFTKEEYNTGKYRMKFVDKILVKN